MKAADGGQRFLRPPVVEGLFRKVSRKVPAGRKDGCRPAMFGLFPCLRESPGGSIRRSFVLSGDGGG